MTHEYVLLINGVVIRGEGLTDASAIAWAADTVLAIGSDAEVLAISRGDSAMGDLGGGVVIAVDELGSVQWPTSRRLEVGESANLAVLATDPRGGVLEAGDVRALVLGGRLVSGSLPLDEGQGRPA